MSSMYITWNIGEYSPDKHEIYRTDHYGEGSFSIEDKIGEVDGSTSLFIDPNVEKGKDYYYTVVAYKMGLACPADSWIIAPSLRLGPGPEEPTHGNIDGDAFFGEVPVSEFIRGDVLANELGLTAGNAQYSTEPWLKFSIGGEICFIPRKPYRTRISWNALDDADLVYGNRTININGIIYTVRLMKGANSDPFNISSSSGSTVANPPNVNNSEWNRTIRRVASSGTRTWASYSDAALMITNSSTNGGSQWMMETDIHSNNHALYRGWGNATRAASRSKTNSGGDRGWRPILIINQGGI